MQSVRDHLLTGASKLGKPRPGKSRDWLTRLFSIGREDAPDGRLLADCVDTLAKDPAWRYLKELLNRWSGGLRNPDLDDWTDTELQEALLELCAGDPPEHTLCGLIMAIELMVIRQKRG